MLPFSYCFLAFILIFIVGNLFENLDNFLTQKASWKIVAAYYLFLIPSIFVLTTPLAILLSILYQLGYMSRYNELVALKANGVSLGRIFAPFFIIGIIFSLLIFFVNEGMVPKCSMEIDKITLYYMNGRGENEIQNREKEQKNIAFFSRLNNLSFYCDKLIIGDNVAEEVSIREFYKNGSLKREWFGKKAMWLDGTWWLFDGYIRNYDVENKLINNDSKMQFFKKSRIPIGIQIEDIMRTRNEIEKMSEYMSVGKLYKYIKRNFAMKAVPKELLVDLYRKLSIPITVLIVTVFGVIFGTKISRGGALASVGASLAFYLSYYGISSFFIAMGKLGKITPGFAVWFPQIMFGIFCLYLLKKAR